MFLQVLSKCNSSHLLVPAQWWSWSPVSKIICQLNTIRLFSLLFSVRPPWIYNLSWRSCITFQNGNSFLQNGSLGLFPAHDLVIASAMEPVTSQWLFALPNPAWSVDGGCWIPVAACLSHFDVLHQNCSKDANMTSLVIMHSRTEALTTNENFGMILYAMPFIVYTLYHLWLSPCCSLPGKKRRPSLNAWVFPPGSTGLCHFLGKNAHPHVWMSLWLVLLWLLCLGTLLKAKRWLMLIADCWIPQESRFRNIAILANLLPTEYGFQPLAVDVLGVIIPSSLFLSFSSGHFFCFTFKFQSYYCCLTL